MDLSKDKVLIISNRPWVYRGEGNANIVISLPEEGTILRLRKSSCKEAVSSSIFLQQQQLELKFIDNIMRAILGDAFVKVPYLISLCQEDIQKLNAVLYPLRPEVRHGKNISSSYAQQCEDLALFPVLSPHDRVSVCVEIKPKQGLFSPSTQKAGKCTFCLKQKLKLKEGLVQTGSQYCPLDLFSGYPPKMIRAIQSLLHSPQNNFRIFVDGKVAFQDGNSLQKLEMILSDWLGPLKGSDLKEVFSSLLVQALLTPFPFTCGTSSREESIPWIWNGSPVLHNEASSEKGNNQPELHVQGSCDWTRGNLPEGCVLNRLAIAQALDSYGLDAVTKMVSIYQGATECSLVSESMSCKNLQYINQVLEKKKSSKLDPIEAYLIASVARDCSILVTFQKLLKENAEDDKSKLFPSLKEEQSGECYRFRVSVVDIDPKPLSCISSHVKKRTAYLNANKED